MRRRLPLSHNVCARTGNELISRNYTRAERERNTKEPTKERTDDDWREREGALERQAVIAKR